MIIKKLCLVFLLFFISNSIISQELVIGKERVDPGIIFIFEGAIKDIVYPQSINLNQNSFLLTTFTCLEINLGSCRLSKYADYQIM